MNTRIAAALMLCLCACAGCGSDNGIRARYELERRYYDATRLEHAAYANYPVDSFNDWRMAVVAYRIVLASNPAGIPESRGWDAGAVDDMKRTALRAELGLLRLEYLDYRLHDAVTHPAPDTGAWPERSRGFAPLALEHAQVLYDSLGPDPLGQRCVRRLRAVADDPHLWSDTSMVCDSVLVIPLGLASVDSAAAAFAEGFYARVVKTWPGTATAGRAYDYRQRLRVARGEFAGALVDVDSAAAVHPDAGRREALRLRRGEILAFGLGRRGDARSAFRDVIVRAPAGRAAWYARLHLAQLDTTSSGLEMLRAIHLDARAPDDVVALAMLFRALRVERGGDWLAATNLLWRLTALEPDTEPALAAPLRVIDLLLRREREADARESLTRVCDDYVDVIRRDSAALQPRHLAKDCLVEAVLRLSTAEKASEVLHEATRGTRGDNAMVLAFKQALVERYLGGSTEKAVEILEKSLVLNPRSRYSRCVRHELERAREARDGQT